MIPKRDPYPIIQNVPEHIVIRARQMVAKRVNPEAKWFYMQGKGDHYTVVQAVIEALMDDAPSAATPPRSGQPGTGKAPPRSCQAASFPRSGHEHVCVSPADSSCVPTEMVTLSAGKSVTPFPHPCANPSLRMATGVDGSEPSASSIDPAFFAAWRETQYGPNDMEPA